MPGHGGLDNIRQSRNRSGGSATIEVEVDPAAHGPQGTGPAKKVVYIETDDSQKVQLMMDINVIEVGKQPNLDIQCPSWVLNKKHEKNQNHWK